MGTYYAVTFRDSSTTITKPKIDSILIALNNEVSTYIASSAISGYNQSTDPIVTIGSDQTHFWTNYRLSKEIYTQSEGFFNPQIMPLVNFWGFGYTKKDTTKDVAVIPRLVSAVQSLQEAKSNGITKSDPLVKLDFSAVAKGYGVDLLVHTLALEGVTDYLVDIGGESRGKGVNKNGNIWTVGIQNPKEGASINDVKSAIQLNNSAIATSGNYRNFYEENGKKFVHTINPFTGFSERSNLLSASVLVTQSAFPCATADGWATAFMTMGVEKAIKKASEIEYLDAYFIYIDSSTNEVKEYLTPGFQQVKIR